MNSLPSYEIWYLVTNHTDLIQNRLNSLCLTKYHSSLVTFDKTWSEFSTLESAECLTCTNHSVPTYIA